MVKVKNLLDNNPLKTDWLAFGKYMIHTGLLQENILLLKYTKSYAPIPWLRRLIIDDIFKEFWIELIETKTISYGLLKKCSTEQVELLNKIIIKSQINIEFNIKNALMSPDDITEKLELLQGQLTAGNDHPNILIEARNVINKLYLINKITKSQMEELLDDLLDDLKTF
jgi:hypothetical protein